MSAAAIRGAATSATASQTKQSVTLPGPEQSREFDGVGAGHVEEIGGRERDRRGAEEACADAQKGQEQEELQRVDEMVGDLGGGEVEAEEEGDDQAGDGGRSEHGIDADGDTDREAPGETLGAGSEAEQREDGLDQLRVDPAVVGGGLRKLRRGVVGGHF